MQEIAQWLKRPLDYKAGVALYEKYGSNATLLFVLKLNESGFNREKLKEALEEISSSPVADDEPKPQRIVPQNKPQFAAVSIPSLQGKQAELDGELKMLYKVQSGLHSKLKLMVKMNYPIAGCKPLCFEILDIGKQIKSIRTTQIYIDTHGDLPEQLKSSRELGPVDMMRVVMNNRAYISKFEGQEAKKEEWERRVIETRELEKILNINQKSHEQS